MGVDTPVGGAAVIGPVVRTDAATARAGGQLLGALPPPIQMALLMLGLLAGMIGCSAAWIDYQNYTPSPNICRADQVQRAAQLGCVPSQQVPTGWQR
ncbi:hypothetical protein [Nocardia sp. NPDC050435]|uniref:hypothetical protein n=1 Tax=Nocardia sp. NPDC050435 TaxID=3155040 RepID=UPI0033D6476D